MIVHEDSIYICGSTYQCYRYDLLAQTEWIELTLVHHEWIDEPWLHIIDDKVILCDSIIYDDKTSICKMDLVNRSLTVYQIPATSRHRNTYHAIRLYVLADSFYYIHRQYELHAFKITGDTLMNIPLIKPRNWEILTKVSNVYNVICRGVAL
jgi:hypothetical protein